MRVYTIIPSGRTLTREQYKMMDSIMRKMWRENKDQIMQKTLDAILYGTAYL